MMLAPFRFREVAGRMLVTGEAGDYGYFEKGALDRFFDGGLTDEERRKFRELSVIIDEGDEWRLASLMRRIRDAHSPARKRLSYLIVVPTLRCDLSCSYCQVSRAALDAKGFDWTEAHLSQFEKFIAGIDSDHLKLEFQGGEPTVRPDLLRRIIDMCVGRFKSAEFVICTNLTRITPESEALFGRDDVLISTSIDGPVSVMTANRTSDDEISRAVFANFNYLAGKYGAQKISALPTVTEQTIDDPRSLIDFYVSLGFQSIFLRPVNYMGFARKKHSALSRDFAVWEKFYHAAVEHIIEINKEIYFEEYYLSMIVRSVFGGLAHGYVDLRSPARFASDYCVIDFDGTLYPSDEARMLSRTRTIDLGIGSMAAGFDAAKVAQLNQFAMNEIHPDCVHCAYLPYCGIDAIDDISRYGRIDLPKQDTWFCRRQMSLFDFVFDKLEKQDVRYLSVFLKWLYRRNNPPPSFELFHD
jgi:His-Xaa-Ser system radical SAM maturase HxsB